MVAGSDTRDAGDALVAGLCAPSPKAVSLPATMVVVAHPDDETVGIGSRLPRLAQAWFVHVTDGAPRDGADAARHGLSAQAYAQERRGELAKALRLAGIEPDRATCLGCPDQQAALRLAEVAHELLRLFTRHGTQAVLTHPYEGGHPDHDATAFAVHAAAALMRRQGGNAPAIVEMASYHLGPEGLRTSEFLPPAGPAVGTIELAPVEQQAKRALVSCFRTQRDTLRWFPLERERLRPAPPYDFLRPPHEGTLFYEQYPWRMTGQRFRSLCAEVLHGLGLEGRL